LAADALKYQPPGLLRNGHLQTLLGSVWPVCWLIRRRAARLRSRTPPIVGYIERGQFKLDLRTVFRHQDSEIVAALRAAN